MAAYHISPEFIQMNWDLCENMKKQILLSCTLETLNEGHGSSNWYEIVDFGDDYSAVFDTYYFINIRRQANTKAFSFQQNHLIEKISINYATQTCKEVHKAQPIQTAH